VLFGATPCGRFQMVSLLQIAEDMLRFSPKYIRKNLDLFVPRSLTEAKLVFSEAVILYVSPNNPGAAEASNEMRIAFKEVVITDRGPPPSVVKRAARAQKRRGSVGGLCARASTATAGLRRKSMTSVKIAGRTIIGSGDRISAERGAALAQFSATVARAPGQRGSMLAATRGSAMAVSHGTLESMAATARRASEGAPLALQRRGTMLSAASDGRIDVSQVRLSSTASNPASSASLDSCGVASITIEEEAERSSRSIRRSARRATFAQRRLTPLARKTSGSGSSGGLLGGVSVGGASVVASVDGTSFSDRDTSSERRCSPIAVSSGDVSSLSIASFSERSVSHAGKSAVTIQAATTQSQGPKPTRFLVYLNKQTFRGKMGEAFAQEVRDALAADLKIAVVHENDDTRDGCEFDLFFKTSAHASCSLCRLLPCTPTP
jgi:hypothetical protein